MAKVKGMRTFREYLIETLQDPEEGQAYLIAALEEYNTSRDLEAFLIALHSLAMAQGGLSALARKSDMNRQNLHKILSGKRSPKWETMGAILQGLGYKLSVEPFNSVK